MLETTWGLNWPHCSHQHALKKESSHYLWVEVNKSVCQQQFVLRCEPSHLLIGQPKHRTDSHNNCLWLAELVKIYIRVWQELISTQIFSRLWVVLYLLVIKSNCFNHLFGKPHQFQVIPDFWSTSAKMKLCHSSWLIINHSFNFYPFKLRNKVLDFYIRQTLRRTHLFVSEI